MRRRYRRQPQKLLRRYIRRAKEQLRVQSEAQHWSLLELTVLHKPAFGRMIGLWRAYHAFAELLELQMAGHTLHAAAYNVQCLKMLHQVALDGGTGP